MGGSFCSGMNTDNTYLFKLVIAGFVWALLHAGPAWAENKYGLTTEDVFSEVYDREVVPYWERYGKREGFTGKDDVDIQYMTFLREDEKAAVVIVNGRTESFIKYRELVYDIGKQGYSVYAYDHRGQGFSGRMTSNPHMGHVDSFEDYVEDLKTFVSTVVEKQNHDKLFLLSHSMGAAVASIHIARHQADFDAAVLSSPMHTPSSGKLPSSVGCAGVTFTRSLRDFFISLLGWEPRYLLGTGDYKRPAFQGSKLTHSEVRHEKYRDIYDEHPTIQIGGPTTHWASNACKGGELARESAADILIPVLVLQAGDDIAVNTDGQDEFCENINEGLRNECAGGKPHVLEGAYHELFMEADIYRIPALTLTLDFLEEQLED